MRGANFFSEFIKELFSRSSGELGIVLEVVAVDAIHKLEMVHVVHEERLKRREMKTHDTVGVGEESRVDDDIRIAVYQHTPGEGEGGGERDDKRNCQRADLKIFIA